MDIKQTIQVLMNKHETINETIEELECCKFDELEKGDDVFDLQLCLEIDKQISILKRKLFLQDQEKYFEERYDDGIEYVYDTKIVGNIGQKKKQFSELFKCLVCDFQEQNISTKKFIDTINNMLLDIDYIEPLNYNKINELVFHN